MADVCEVITQQSSLLPLGYQLRLIKDADEAASVAHDFIYGKNGVTKQQASDAIWRIHNALRPLLPLTERPDFPEIIRALQERGDG